MATDRALPSNQNRAETHEPYISWRADFFVLFVLAVLFAGIVTSFLVL